MALKFNLLLPAFLLIVSCKKEGCTKPGAINYAEDAKKDDGRCQFESTAFVGSFMVEDSTYGDYVPYTQYHQYTLEIYQDPNDLSLLILKNIGDINNDSYFLHISGEVENNVLVIPNQVQTLSSSSGTGQEYHFYSGSMSMSGDSVFFNYVFSGNTPPPSTSVTGWGKRM